MMMLLLSINVCGDDSFIDSNLQGGLNLLLCQSSTSPVDLWHRSITRSVIETVMEILLLSLAIVSS